MNPELLNILSQAKDSDQKKLIDYLEGNLSSEERHEIEKLLVESPFESDAAEGLGQIKNKKALPGVVNDLNKKIIKKLTERRKKLLKKESPNLNIPITATIVIIILVIIFYLFIRGQL